jgi:cysteine-rich repeat protein
MKKATWLLAALPCILLARGVEAGAIRSLAGFSTNTLPANDDGSTGFVPIGSSVNFFGTIYGSLYVNNNGNVTFDLPLSTFTPFDLTSTGRVIIAPFFGDVDTRGAGSAVVTYGNDTVGGRPAFGVDWDGVGVGYYSVHVDKLNKFQLILIDRSDIAAGDFDIEFNYDQLQWETGDASGGSGGLGGASARAGYSNGTGAPGTSFELAGSAINGALLDSNPTTGLIYNSLNSTQSGRYVFNVRNGVPEACGNGILEGSEDCDDSNVDNGDCCSSTCAFESLGSSCDTDATLCTVEECDGAGTCNPVSTVTCQAANPPCEGGEACNPSTGLCDPQPDASPGTPCEADGDLCTNDQCDGNGSCVFFSSVSCQAAVPPCEGGETCNPGTGACDPEPDAPSSTPCEADADLCTNDHCDGNGSCILLSTVTCTALDQCHLVGTCSPGTGACSNPIKADGQVCDDANICTQGDHCVGGACTGILTGADTDDDGYCDFQEIQAGCNPGDAAEIPPQSVAFGGMPSEHSLGTNGLITHHAPVGFGHRVTVSRGSDPSCSTSGICASTGFCTAGAIGDPCTANAECNQPANRCRMVINYGDVSDLSLTRARLGRTDVLTNFQPVTPGCSRKVELDMDPAVPNATLKLRATGTLSGRLRRDNDRFLFAP